MANILDKKTCDKIKTIRNTEEYQKYSDIGWCCEGADDNCITVFNWKSDEDKGYLLVNYLTNTIITNQLIDVSLAEIMPFVHKECEIARLAYGNKSEKSIDR